MWYKKIRYIFKKIINNNKQIKSKKKKNWKDFLTIKKFRKNYYQLEKIAFKIYKRITALV